MYLMLMDISHSECIRSTFFGIKTYGYSLNGAYIINRGIFFKVGKSYLAAVLVYLYRCYGCRNLLNKRKILLPVIFICMIYHMGTICACPHIIHETFTTIAYTDRTCGTKTRL